MTIHCILSEISFKESLYLKDDEKLVLFLLQWTFSIEEMNRISCSFFSQLLWKAFSNHVVFFCYRHVLVATVISSIAYQIAPNISSVKERKAQLSPFSLCFPIIAMSWPIPAIVDNPSSILHLSHLNGLLPTMTLCNKWAARLQLFLF